METDQGKIQKINALLESLHKRIRASNLYGEDYGRIEFYNATPRGILVVFWDFHGEIKSILRVKNRWERYTYLPNGQPGINTEQVYFKPVYKEA